jgi:DnaJ domain
MLIWLIAGLALLIGGLALLRWIAVAEPRTLALALKTAAVAVLAVLAVLILLSGRIGWLLGLLPLLLPFVLPFVLRRGAWHAASPFGGLSGGGGPQASQVRTRFLDMRLDHATGELDGEILEGEHAGRSLSELADAELFDLYRGVLATDRKTARLLEAYLDRRCPDWRGGREKAAGPDEDDRPDDGIANGAPMTREEAYRVLGLEPGAAEGEIREAYLRLIAHVHPDRGGSSFLAAQVNRARDVLLGGKASR